MMKLRSSEVKQPDHIYRPSGHWSQDQNPDSCQELLCYYSTTVHLWRFSPSLQLELNNPFSVPRATCRQHSGTQPYSVFCSVCACLTHDPTYLISPWGWPWPVLCASPSTISCTQWTLKNIYFNPLVNSKSTANYISEEPFTGKTSTQVLLVLVLKIMILIKILSQKQQKLTFSKEAPKSLRASSLPDCMATGVSSGLPSEISPTA